MAQGAQSAERASWSSRATFIFAAVGSAVGLGNIWKFPYEAGESGGGAFVLVYLAFVLILGVPVMIAELAVGRRGQLSPPSAILRVARQDGAPIPRFWTIVGWAGIVGAFLVLSYYSVIAGWTLFYFIGTLTGSIDASNADASQASFAAFTRDNQEMTFWHFLFMVLTVLIVIRGLKGGLERAVTWMTPLLFALLIILVIYSLSVGNAGQAVDFLFAPDFSKLTPEVVIQALGQAFFSLSLGLGTIMVYGSYLPKTISIPRSALIIAGADTMVALLAGLAIFPLVFQFGLQPAGGPGLIFITLPIAFDQMPGGLIFGALFFLLLAIAALTSAISLLEPVVSRLEEWTKTRNRATLIAAVAVFLTGIATVLSFNTLAEVTFWRGTIFDNLDFVTNNVIMPLGGLILIIFTGWALPETAMRDELSSVSSRIVRLWRLAARYVCPIAMAAIFLNQIGILA